MKTRTCSICRKKFEPLNTGSKVCSPKCCVRYYDTYKGKKSKMLARKIARMVGMRSMAEVRFAAGLERIPYTYEPDTFEYEVAETKKYTPDFRFEKSKSTKRSPKYFYVEFKGVFSAADRKKAKLFREQHPEVELYFVFMAPNNKLSKVSKTTYGMWCDQNGFEWSDKLERKWFTKRR